MEYYYEYLIKDAGRKVKLRVQTFFIVFLIQQAARALRVVPTSHRHYTTYIVSYYLFLTRASSFLSLAACVWKNAF